jgi:hypothetical protein
LDVPPPPQVFGDVQVPQELTVRVVLQLSTATKLPQLRPKRAHRALSLSGSQGFPHWLGVPPPPQVFGAAQPPQELTVRVTPQLSRALSDPQALPSRAHRAASLSGLHDSPH